MKKTFLLMAIVLSFVFISCEKEKLVCILDLTMSPTDESRAYPYIWGQDENLDVTFSLVAEISGRSDVTIKTLEVYLKDELISTTHGGTEAVISCPLANIPKGVAVLKTVATCSDKEHSDEYKLTKPFYLWITEVKPVTTASINCQSTITNGKNLNCTFDYTCNVQEAEVYCTELYLDGKSVAMSLTAPFDISYPIQGLSNGNHEVYGVVTWTNKGSHMFSMPCVTDKKQITVE